MKRDHKTRQRHRSALTSVLAFISIFGAFLPKIALAFSCSISPTGVSFLPYSPINPLPETGTGNIHISCHSTLADLIDLIISIETSLSPGNSGTYFSREMRNGAASISYNLYTDVTYNTVWGDGNNGTATVSRTGIILPLLGTVAVDLTVYGRIPAGQTNIVTGDYSDTITVTVIF